MRHSGKTHKPAKVKRATEYIEAAQRAMTARLDRQWRSTVHPIEGQSVNPAVKRGRHRAS